MTTTSMLRGCLLLACASFTIACQALAQRAARRPSPKDIAQRDAAMRELLGAANVIAKPLEDLSESQRASIVSLMLLTYAAANYQRGISPDASITAGFVGVVGHLLPSAPTKAAFADLARDCMSESIAYASAMASCEKAGTDEDHCIAAWEAGSREIICMMKVVGGLKGVINGIFGGLKPPQPQPWPYAAR